MAAAPIQHTASQKNTKQAAEVQFSSVIQLERLNLLLQSIMKVNFIHLAVPRQSVNLNCKSAGMEGKCSPLSGI